MALIGGVLHYQNDPNDQASVGPVLGSANALNKQVAQTRTGDNLKTSFVDVRAFVDPVLGMLSTADAGCNASANPGYHVNNCGTFQLEEAFWEAVNGSSTPVAMLRTKTAQ